MIPIPVSVRVLGRASSPCMTLSDPHPSFKPGEILLGKYEVVSTLGVGGMGVVTLVRHQQLDELFAIKVLKPQFVTMDHTTARFLREARAAVKIRSVHGARIVDVGVFPGGSPYMVMEYLTGRDLATWIAQDGPLPPDLAVDFTLQSLEALAEAHALGIVHRDIKPANLFVTVLPGGTSCVKVLDFGISKASGFFGATPTGNATEPGALMGSPSYMSPEQFSSASTVDVRSDIWAVGATLFELLTGESAFTGSSLAQIYAAVVHEPLSPIRALRPEISEGLAHVVERCLAKDPADRYQNVGELAAALEDQLPASYSGRAQRIGRVVGMSGLGGSAFDKAGEVSSSPPVAGTVPIALVRRSERRQRRMRALATGAVAAVGLALVVALGWGRFDSAGGYAKSARAGLVAPARDRATAVSSESWRPGVSRQRIQDDAIAGERAVDAPRHFGSGGSRPSESEVGAPRPPEGRGALGRLGREVVSVGGRAGVAAAPVEQRLAEPRDAEGQREDSKADVALPLTEEDKRRLYGIRK